MRLDTLARWLTRNRSDLEAEAEDPRLRPVFWELAPAAAVARAADRIAGLPRWRVVSRDPDAGTLHATHTTRFWRFVDDVHLRFEPAGSGTRIVGHSQSRIGKGDFGQNARNLRELTAALRGNAVPPDQVR
jgi:uncharacterized protein (DUF1499 family)